jgi:hypothetical protein
MACPVQLLQKRAGGHPDPAIASAAADILAALPGQGAPPARAPSARPGSRRQNDYQRPTSRRCRPASARRLRASTSAGRAKPRTGKQHGSSVRSNVSEQQPARSPRLTQARECGAPEALPARDRQEGNCKLHSACADDAVEQQHHIRDCAGLRIPASFAAATGQPYQQDGTMSDCKGRCVQSAPSRVRRPSAIGSGDDKAAGLSCVSMPDGGPLQRCHTYRHTRRTRALPPLATASQSLSHPADTGNIWHLPAQSADSGNTRSGNSIGTPGDCNVLAAGGDGASSGPSSGSGSGSGRGSSGGGTVSCAVVGQAGWGAAPPGTPCSMPSHEEAQGLRRTVQARGKEQLCFRSCALVLRHVGRSCAISCASCLVVVLSQVPHLSRVFACRCAERWQHLA